MKAKKLVHPALFLVAAFYAGNFTVAKIIMPSIIQPFGFVLTRVAVAGFFILLFHAIFIREKVKSWKDLALLFVCSFFGVTLNTMLFFKGLSLTTPINASVMMITAPIFVVVFAGVYLKERVGGRKIFGILLGLIGAFFLIAGNSLTFSSDNTTGNLLVAMNAMSYATYLVLVKPLLSKYNPITIVKWSFIFGFMMILPFSYNEFMAVDWFHLDATSWWSIAYVIFGITIFAYLANAWALTYVNSSVVGAYIFLQPVLATIIATLAGSDTLTLRKSLLSILVILGVYLVSVTREQFINIKTFVLNKL